MPAHQADPTQDCLADVPVYAHVKEVRLLHGELEALEITYITLYAHNGWYALLGYGPHVGAHDGDWEHLTVRLQAPSFGCQARALPPPEHLVRFP